MGCLTKAEILSATDRSPVRVDVPEWGGHVYVRGLSGTQRGELEEWQTANAGSVGMDGQLVAMSLCDETGEPLGFSDAEVDSLNDRSSVALQRVIAVVRRLSILDAESVAAAEKN